MIKTRFAPSPTGWLHIGGVRTALFSWLFARSQSGKFFLRIDDTDTSRSTDEFRDSIISALNKLGLKSDDEIIYQSERFEIYIDKIEYLLSKDLAYYDKVEVNDKTKDTNLKIQYVNRLNKPGHVIRFKNPRDNSVELDDLIHGKIKFDPKTFHDVVILRSNGVPTYNLTTVVDDSSLGITHIIRGDDHLSNTSIQINLFKSLGETIPKFAHLPMIHGTDGKRLSKRHGAVDINSFINDGYLEEALINYLAKTGWSNGDQEFFSIDELIQLFKIEKVTKSSAIFDYDKLNWLNQHYIKNTKISDIADMILPYLEDINITIADRSYLEDILRLGIEREYNLKSIANSLEYYFVDELSYDDDLISKYDKLLMKSIVEKTIKSLENNLFKENQSISEDLNNVCKDLDLKFKDIGPIIRFALTGRLKAPSIDELCITLGKSRALDRLSRFNDHLK